MTRRDPPGGRRSEVRGAASSLSAWRVAALAAQFGFIVAGALLAGAWLGFQLDARLHTTPAFLVVGVFVGLATSLYLMYLLYRLQARGG